ncbi:MAG TPA: HAD family hydrolase [Candidatus Norongarragalinales archaeon]|nr:HAD family hydrolase [Candidatus Norongarragalinales archaeon]
MIKLVVFDWNGTLLADTLASVESINRVLKKLGRNQTLSVKKCRETMTLPIVDFYASHGFDRDYLKKSAALIQETFHGHYARRAERTRTRKGARKTLSWLKANGIERIILSNHLVTSINLSLENFRLAHLFSEVLANSDVHTVWIEKNKLRKLQDYLATKDLAPEEVMLVGDSLEEIDAARHLGLKSVAITDGICSRKRLKSSSPDFIIRSLSELIGVVKKSNGPSAGKKKH